MVLQIGNLVSYSVENTTIPPESTQAVKGKLSGSDLKRSLGMLCIEPATILIQGLYAARVLSRVTEVNHGGKKVCWSDSKSGTNIAGEDQSELLGLRIPFFSISSMFFCIKSFNDVGLRMARFCLSVHCLYQFCVSPPMWF